MNWVIYSYQTNHIQRPLNSIKIALSLDKNTLIRIYTPNKWPKLRQFSQLVEGFWILRKWWLSQSEIKASFEKCLILKNCIHSVAQFIRPNIQTNKQFERHIRIYVKRVKIWQHNHNSQSMFSFIAVVMQSIRRGRKTWATQSKANMSRMVVRIFTEASCQIQPQKRKISQWFMTTGWVYPQRITSQNYFGRTQFWRNRSSINATVDK